MQTNNTEDELAAQASFERYQQNIERLIAMTRPSQLTDLDRRPRALAAQSVGSSARKKSSDALRYRRS